MPRNANRRPRQPQYTPTEWSDYFDENFDVTIDKDIFRIYKINANKENGPVFFMHHGAGSSGLTFSVTAKHIKEITGGECAIMAIDARGHGATKVAKDPYDFSLETFSNDLIRIIQHVVKEDQDIILVGHR